MPKGYYKRSKKQIKFLHKISKKGVRSRWPDSIYSLKQKRKAIQDYKKGKTSVQIAKEIGCASASVRHWIRTLSNKNILRYHPAYKNTDHLKRLNESEKAYLAGLMDGEGCITIAFNKRPKFSNCDLTIQIYNTCQKTMQYVRKKLGGALNSKQNKPNRICYRWQASCYEAEAVLKILLPHLRIKILQAKVALKFQKNKSKGIKVQLEFKKMISNLNHGID